MALTRIKTNQITDLNVTTGKIANNAVTGAKLANNLSYGSDFTVTGNLTVSGTTTSVSTTNTRVEDAIIALSAEATGSASVDSGLLINRGDDDNYALIWDESADQFVAANVGSEDGDTAGNVTISSYANFQAGTITYATLNDGSNDITSTAAEINLIDGSSAGTIVNSKAVIYGSSGEVNATTLQIGGSSITATAAELNIMDGDTSVGTDAFASGDGLVTNDAGTMKQTSVDTLDTYLSASTKTLTNKTIDSASNTLTLDLSEGTLTGTTSEFNSALSDGSFATLAGTETLSNKTLTAPKIVDGGFIADANGNELVIFTTTASAVNEITVANAAASGHPAITTTGSDTNINLVLSPKGSGTIDVDTSKIVNVTDPTANQDAATKAYVDTQVSSASGLVIAADTGSNDTVTVGTDTLTFAGTANEITTAVTDNQIQIGLPDDVTIGGDATITGNLTVNGTTTTLSTTNSVVSDSLIELNNGAGSNSNDLGLIFERGSTGDNAVFAWDESEDKFTLGTTTATGASTGNLTITSGTLVAALEGNASTATALETARDIALAGDVTGTASFDGSGNISITTTIAANSVALGTDTTGDYVGTITGGNGIASSGATSGEGIDHSLSVDLTDTNIFASDGTASRAVVLDGSGDFTANAITTTNIDGILGANTAAAASVTTLGTTGEATLASAIVSDLTSGRVVLAGTSGAIEDSGNLTFDGSTLAVTGAITASSNVDIADAGSLRVGTGNDFTINHDGTDTAITNGTGLLTIDGTATSAIRVNEAGANVDFVVEGDTNTALLTVDASQDNVGIGGAPNANAILDVNDTGAILLARGTTAQRPTAVTGMFRYNTTSNTLEYYSNTAWTGISSDFTLATSQTFNGDNSTVAFTLSSLTGSDSYTVAGVLVMLNGVVQEPTTVYGISGTTLTFTTAPASGDLIEVRKFTTTTTITALTDSDGDTQVLVEESADEDIIRFDIGGSEKMVLNSTQLSVTGNIVATGDITANGDITLGDGNTDTITLGAEIGSDIIPDTDGSRDLGSATNRWAEAHIDDVLLGPQGDIRFYDSDASNFVAFQSAGTVASDITWTLPNADAAVSGYALVSDASGTLSWAAAGATTTSDTTTNAEEQLYFGDITSGAVTAVHHDADLTYNPSTGSLSSDVFIGALTGNASTATALETARTIAGNSFDGTANITIASTDLSDTADLARLAGPAFTGTATGVNLTLSGDLTVNGTTTTLSTTNTVISDNLIELNNGAGSNANDSGIVIERGSTGDNAFMGWDESADKFVFGTTTATGASTGDLTISSGTVVANTFEGALSGNATTASAWETARTLSLAGDASGSASVDGSGNVSLTVTVADDSHNHVVGNIDGIEEYIQDVTGAMFSSNTESGISVTYQDGDGTIDLNVNDPTISLTGDVTGSATMTNLGNVSISTTVAANSVALGTDTTGNYVAAGATSGSGISGSVSSEGGTFTVTSNATNANTGSTIVFRDGSGNFSAGTITASLSGTATNATNFNVAADNSTNSTHYLIFTGGTSGNQRPNSDTGLTYNPSSNTLSTSIFSGTSTAARYADLAEMYAADAEIEPGTVVHFAGEGKLAACDTENCRTVAGIVSTDPAHLMNADQEGVALALAGRVPCKVTGVVNAGDLMVSAGNGMAMANNEAAMGTVIGKAIEANEGGEGVIEVLALMM